MSVLLTRVSRRAFVAESASFLSAIVLSRRTSLWRAPIVVRIGVVSQPTSQSRRFGLDLGLDEAKHAATLFGGSIVDVPLTAPRADDGKLSAIVGGGDETSALEWTRYAAEHGTIYMNVGCPTDRLRQADCSQAAFHIAPSDAMVRDAIAAAGGGATGRAEAWDPSLSRFGADTLNQRFLTRFHQPMTSDAWAAWFAVKALWESALRRRSGDASAIADYLLRDTTQFDGHKGSPLSFRTWDHQLRQPLYVASGKTDRPKEVPEITGDIPVRDALDRLGGGHHETACERT